MPKKDPKFTEFPTMRVTTYYCVTKWAAEDVKSLRPRWSLKKCEKWLQDNSKYIQERLTELGFEVMEHLLDDI